MKLQELQGYRAFQDKSLSELFNRWIKDGKIRVRSGSYAFVVIPADGDFVYKVWNKDPAFEDFLQYAKTHQSDKHVVKLIGRQKALPFVLKRPETYDTIFKIQKLEKLEPLVHGSGRYTFVQALMILFRKVKLDRLTDDDIPEIISAIAKKYNVSEHLMEPSFVKSAIAVSNEAGRRNDFHPDNVMLRDGETLVITDPYSESVGDTVATASDVMHNQFWGKHQANGPLKTGRS